MSANDGIVCVDPPSATLTTRVPGEMKVHASDSPGA